MVHSFFLYIEVYSLWNCGADPVTASPVVWILTEYQLLFGPVNPLSSDNS